jgi:hypothetical protein
MPHLHMSFQSGDDMILKRMKRRHSRAPGRRDGAAPESKSGRKSRSAPISSPASPRRPRRWPRTAFA